MLPRNLKQLTFTLLVFAVASASAAWGAVIRVPGDLPTIQQGLDSASTDDTVLVAPGTYVEHIAWPNTQGIDLIGEFGADATTIDGDSLDRVITMSSSMTSSTLIRGFRIQNGNANSGGGLYCSRASPLILDITFTNNWALSGGAVFCTDSASPAIQDCIFWSNSAGEYLSSGAGGAIYCGLFSNATLYNNTLARNSAGLYGGAIYAVMCSTVIKGNAISENGALAGGGIACQACYALIDSNRIIDNQSRWDDVGGGILFAGSRGIIQNNEIVGNIASVGGGIACVGSSPRIRGNLIESNGVGNPSLSTGGGISCEGSSPAIERNIIRGNSALNGYGGGISCRGSSPTITHNLITANGASFIGAGIFTDSRLTVDSNNIFRNGKYDLFYSQPGTLDASQNWWGDASGPFDPSTGPPDYNPDGLGALISNYISYRPWLTDSVTTACGPNGRGQRSGISDDRQGATWFLHESRWAQALENR